MLCKKNSCLYSSTSKMECQEGLETREAPPRSQRPSNSVAWLKAHISHLWQWRCFSSMSQHASLTPTWAKLLWVSSHNKSHPRPVKSIKASSSSSRFRGMGDGMCGDFQSNSRGALNAKSCSAESFGIWYAMLVAAAPYALCSAIAFIHAAYLAWVNAMQWPSAGQFQTLFD